MRQSPISVQSTRVSSFLSADFGSHLIFHILPRSTSYVSMLAPHLCAHERPHAHVTGSIPTEASPRVRAVRVLTTNSVCGIAGITFYC